MHRSVEETPKPFELLQVVPQLVWIVFYKIEAILMSGPELDEN